MSLPDNLEAMKSMAASEFEKKFPSAKKADKFIYDSLRNFFVEKWLEYYYRGKEDGMDEEAIGCMKHCEASWNSALDAAKEAMRKKLDTAEWHFETDVKINSALSAIDGLRK